MNPYQRGHKTGYIVAKTCKQRHGDTIEQVQDFIDRIVKGDSEYINGLHAGVAAYYGEHKNDKADRPR